MLFLDVGPQQALAAMEALNGKPLDKNHSFLVKPFSDIDRLAKLSDNYTPPPAKEFKAVVSNSQLLTAGMAANVRGWGVSAVAGWLMQNGW
jgi:hypothetical protein